jgi:hypothetical protein
VVSVRALALALLVACGGSTIESGGFKVQKDYTLDAFSKVRARATFDFQCADNQLQLVVLSVAPEGSAPCTKCANIPDQIGATGCGRRATYVASPEGWVDNSAPH